jgi:Holliday junction resolvase RusA-like endonuclease
LPQAEVCREPLDEPLLPVPLSVRISARLSQQTAKERKERYQWEARGQYHGKSLAEGLKLTVTLLLGRRGRRDADNYSKLILDACTGIVWKDDSQIENPDHHQGLRQGESTYCPRVRKRRQKWGL